MQKNQNGEIEELIKSINDNPDNLHTDNTPSVRRLSELGLPALRAVLPLLGSKDLGERLRAQRVLEVVIARKFGWKHGQGYADSKAEQEVTELMQQNGSYRANASPDARSAAIEKWSQWLKNNTDD